MTLSPDTQLIKALLKLYDPKLRKLDAEVARYVYGWKCVKQVNDHRGDWIGKNSDGKVQLIPNFSSSQELAEKIVADLREHPFLKAIRQQDSVHGVYFQWNALIISEGKVSRLAQAERPSAAEAICAASVDLCRFLKRGGKWRALQVSYDEWVSAGRPPSVLSGKK